MTKAKLNYMLKEGDITQQQFDQFHEGAHFYFRDSLKYVQDKFLIINEVMCNSVWVDVVKRHESTWNYLELFLQKFPSVSFMTKIDNNALCEEFIDYQSLTDDEIGAAAFKDTEVTMTDSFNHRLEWSDFFSQ